VQLKSTPIKVSCNFYVKQNSKPLITGPALNVARSAQSQKRTVLVTADPHGFVSLAAILKYYITRPL